MDADFSIWQGGITKDQFERAKDRGVYYQIINHKLYRESVCMFPARQVHHILILIKYVFIICYELQQIYQYNLPDLINDVSDGCL